MNKKSILFNRYKRFAQRSQRNFAYGEILIAVLFVLLAFAASLGATVARLVAQPKMHEVEP